MARSASPSRLARCHTSHAGSPSPPTSGSVASQATTEAAGSSNRAQHSASGTIQPSPAWASIMRSSSQPRGRTGGNIVPRW